MNFNLKSNEYDLQASQTRELIRLYGIPCKLLLAERVNKDLIFGDHSHIKVDNKSVFDIHLLPENSEEYDQMDKLQTQFGIPVETSVNFFVAKESINEKVQQSINVDSYNEFNILEPDDTIKRIISSLLIMPSGKILEITNVDFECVGTNNMFVYNYSKNVYKLFCKTYIHNVANEIEVDTTVTTEDSNAPLNNNTFETLDQYFDELQNTSNKQSQVASEFVVKEDDVFGRF